jgi:hypothetical protein
MKITEGAQGSGTPARAFPRPAKLGLLRGVCGVKIRPSFNDRNVETRLSESVGGHAAPGTGAYDYGVVFFVVLFYLHEYGFLVAPI